jgi:hypothetical protein
VEVVTSLEAEMEESLTMLVEVQETEILSSDTNKTTPQHKSGLLNLSDTEITSISETSKETNV